MREYGKVSPRFWIGETGKKIRQAGHEAQVIALYLLTCPHANMIGLYYLSLSSICHETGSPLEGASKALRSLSEALFCSYDTETEMVWVHEMARFQIGSGLSLTDKRCAGVQREYDELPNNPFLSAFYDRYQEAFHLKRRRAPSMPLLSPSQGPSKPGAGAGSRTGAGLLETPLPPLQGGASVKSKGQKADDNRPKLDAFATFWNAYPKRVAKQDAVKAWTKLRPNDVVLAELMDGLERAKASADWQREDGRYIPNAATWLNGKRWQDEHKPNANGSGHNQPTAKQQSPNYRAGVNPDGSF